MQIGFERTHGTLIPVEDGRFTNIFVIGKSGTGKSETLARWALDDIHDGQTVAFFGTTNLLPFIPESRTNDVVLFDPTDRSHPISWNPLHNIPDEEKAQVAHEILAAMKSIWHYDGATPNLDLYFLASLRALLDTPDGTLLGVYYMLTSDKYREKVLSYSQDHTIKSFWEDFFNRIPEKERRQTTMSVINKAFLFVVDPDIRNIIGQPTPKFDHKQLQGKILLCNLHEYPLLGSLLLSQLCTAEPMRIYIDDAHVFAHHALLKAFTGHHSTVLSARYLAELSRELRDTVLGTAGTIVAFRLGSQDARALEVEFERVPTSLNATLTELQTGRAHVKAAVLHPELSMPRHGYPERPVGVILAASRRRWASPRAKVEERIARFIESA